MELAALAVLGGVGYLLAKSTAPTGPYPNGAGRREPPAPG